MMYEFCCQGVKPSEGEGLFFQKEVILTKTIHLDVPSKVGQALMALRSDGLNRTF